MMCVIFVIGVDRWWNKTEVINEKYMQKDLIIEQILVEHFYWLMRIFLNVLMYLEDEWCLCTNVAIERPDKKSGRNHRENERYWRWGVLKSKQTFDYSTSREEDSPKCQIAVNQ